MVGVLYDFRVTPNPNLFWMLNLDVEFDNFPNNPLFTFMYFSLMMAPIQVEVLTWYIRRSTVK